MTAAEQARSASRPFAMALSASMTRGTDLTAFTANDVVGRKSRLALTSISNATPAVATLVAHGFVEGDLIQLTTSGVLPAGLSLLTDYYVKYVDADTFQLSLTSGGAAVATTDAGSGTHTAYPIGSAVMEFVLPAGVAALNIRQTLLSLDLAAVPGSMAGMRLHLYSRTPPSRLADNDAWTLTAADLAFYLGYIDLGTPVDVGPVLVVQAANVDRIIVSPGSSIYGYIVTAGAYTPASGTTATVKLVGTEV